MTDTELPVLVVGEALMDVVRSPSGETELPGGSPANVALGLARLGLDVQFLTALAPDTRGGQIAAHLRGSGVSVLPESFSLQATSSAVAQIAEDGAAHYDFDVRWSLPEDFVASPSALLHTGSIAAFLAPGAGAVLDLMHTAPTPLVSFDPNIRPALLGSQHATVQLFEAAVTAATVVKLSDQDASWLYPARTAQEVARHVHGLGPILVAVTLGSEGALLRSGETVIEVAADRVRVADTIGAGDTFMASLIRSVLLADDGFDAAWLKRTGQIAATAAAITVSRPGANLPTLMELDERAKLRK